ncbi:MAG: PHP domain-containing protein [Desulfuromonadaceae bacterium]
MSYPSAPEADLHIHTVGSGHAYSTIAEIAQEAARKGLKMVAMTDHGPALPGGPHAYHFAALRFVPEYLHGVRVLRGIEANIIGIGQLDLDAALLDRFPGSRSSPIRAIPTFPSTIGWWWPKAWKPAPLWKSTIPPFPSVARGVM